jgi:flagellar biosynthesis protein FlhB
MAEEQDNSEKTEEPTQKRLEDARKKGDIAKSQDVPAWFLLLAAAAILAAAEPLSKSLIAPLVRIMDHPHAFDLSNGGAQQLANGLATAIFVPLLIILGVFFGATFLGHLIQHRPLWTFEKIKPELDKVSPIKGFGRLFGPQGWMNLLKSVLKIAAVGAAVAYAVWPVLDDLLMSGQLDPIALLAFMQSVSGRLLVAALVAIGMVAALDFFWQRYSFMQRMKMSRRDLRDEVKQSEGDPQIRARLRQLRQERARRRMMANVPKATVVLTNPTHYSVALRYDPETDAAPVCVAKGADAVALRIREVAQKSGVPLVENPPLARALFALVDIEDPIPREHFEAVAKVISFVMKTARDRKV